MKKVFFTILALLLTSSAFSYPLDIDVNKEHKIPLAIEKFRYWYGDIEYGYLIYLGTTDIAGFETELHLRFLKKKVSKVLLILGPAGISNYNCLKKYKDVLALLNKKYGHFVYQKVTKDPMIEELVSFSACTPIKIELHTIETYWKLKDLEIVATLLGDEDGLYIEIEYIFDKKTPTNNLDKML